jgi:hypothetical protein
MVQTERTTSILLRPCYAPRSTKGFNVTNCELYTFLHLHRKDAVIRNMNAHPDPSNQCCGSLPVWNMSLFEHFFKVPQTVLSLYLEARIRIRMRIKVTSRIRIRICVKVMQISNSASDLKT